MSFRFVSQVPRLVPRPLRGLGDMFSSLPKTWYIPLIERRNHQTGGRTYQWGQYRYINYWDAMDYMTSLVNYGPVIAQDASMYQWNGSQWLKVQNLSND